jgi:hypothetical protein
MSLAEHVNNFSCACGGKDESTRIKKYISKEAWNHLKKLAGTRPGKRLNFKPP